MIRVNCFAAAGEITRRRDVSDCDVSNASCSEMPAMPGRNTQLANDDQEALLVDMATATAAAAVLYR